MTEEIMISVTEERLQRLIDIEYVFDTLRREGFFSWEDADMILHEKYSSPFDPATSYLCLDCNVDTNLTNEYYMVDFDLWRVINPKNAGMLCIGCAEERLGRQLVAKDFIDAPINFIGHGKSERLDSRLTAN